MFNRRAFRVQGSRAADGTDDTDDTDDTDLEDRIHPLITRIFANCRQNKFIRENSRN